jgi:hypothetical protein
MVPSKRRRPPQRGQASTSRSKGRRMRFAHAQCRGCGGNALSSSDSPRPGSRGRYGKARRERFRAKLAEFRATELPPTGGSRAQRLAPADIALDSFRSSGDTWANGVQGDVRPPDLSLARAMTSSSVRSRNSSRRSST